MNIQYNVTGSERKALVKAIAEILDQPINYLGMPTANYQVGAYTITKTSELVFERSSVDNLEYAELLKQLELYGYCGTKVDNGEDDDEDNDGEDNSAEENDHDECDETLDFADLHLTEREELGLGREGRDHWGEDGMQASNVPEPDDVDPYYYTDNRYALYCADTDDVDIFNEEEETNDSDFSAYPSESSEPERLVSVGEQLSTQTTEPETPDMAEVLEVTETSNLEGLDSADIIHMENAAEDNSDVSVIPESIPAEANNATVSDIPDTVLAKVTDNHRLVIELPREQFTDTAIENLRKIISSKSTVIKKALGTDNLTVELAEDKLCFPWFTLTGMDGESDAYTRFVSALCNMAKVLKRVIVKQSDTENDKFTMRLFLIRLGFIGNEYKSARKILLRNLTGNSSWKDGRRSVVIREIVDNDTGDSSSDAHALSDAGIVSDSANCHLSDTEVVPDEK
jgi:hypothetical protein